MGRFRTSADRVITAYFAATAERHKRGTLNLSIVNIERLALALRMTLAELFERVEAGPDRPRPSSARPGG